SANYFTLAPHETIAVKVSAPLNKLEAKHTSIMVSGWNVTKQELLLTPDNK
ncbi:MAG: Exo-beta-D-glucosaminidase Ig-fold domain, partial [Mucilaginibacter sp.]|nr:Exo-beta-D-glucosaminidase Ig-fold domain [Mucilaginibacter sp.]